VTITVPEAINMICDIFFDDRSLEFRDVFEVKVHKQVRYCSDELKNILTWFNEGVECVFLDSKKGECRIYDRRPAVCRVHMVTSDPELCTPPSGRGAYTIGVSHWIEAVIETSMKAAKEFGISLGMAPLPIAISEATQLILGSREVVRSRKTGTVFENDIQGSLYWAKRFVDTKNMNSLFECLGGGISEK
jgi:Fe-S-cluster containining protein